MQETIPKLEEELEILVSKFVTNSANARAPAMQGIRRHRVFEGHRSAILRPGGKEDEIEYREFSAESEIPSDTILYSDLDTILECFIPVAEAMAAEQEMNLFKIMHEVTEKTGNVVDGRGQPLSYEKILEVFETMQIDFDSDGNPKMPTMVINPTLEPRVKQLMNDPAAKEFEKNLGAIIDKKRLEWREREANRTLVG